MKQWIRIVTAACVAALAAGASLADSPQKISPFGIGGDAHTGSKWRLWMPQMAQAGIKTIRTPALNWGTIEPQEGKFNFDLMDRQLAMADQFGMTCGGMFNGLVGWDKKDKRGGLPLNSLKEWSAFVEATVRHANGRIKYWEVWNEPPNGTNNAPPEDYAKVVIATYDAVKKADPTALVGLAAKSVDINYMDRAIRAGAKDHFDYLSFHPYETLGFELDDPNAEPVFMNIVPAARRMLANLQPDKVNCPIWVTELGCNAKRKGEDVQAQAVIKSYAMGITQGIATICWFEGMDGDSGPMGLMNVYANPRPSYVAMKTMIDQLGSYPQSLGWAKVNDKDYIFAFKGDKGNVLIAWAPKGQTDHVDFGQQVTIVDPLTGESKQASSVELTTSPIIIPGAPEKFIAAAQANKGKMMPWDENLSDAKSVWITMEGKTVEHGLHTRAGDAVAADVKDYGGAARAGNLPGGNVYMVDPTFLTYDTVPIEITAEIHWKSDSNPPDKGLKLNYESTHGYSDTWLKIPDNKQWYTVKCRLDDPQFVGKYGFNFRLDRGSYYIRKLTVTKLDK